MVPVTFNGNPAYLIDDQPDWSESPELSATLPGTTEQGLNGIETRRQTGDTLRLGFKFTAVLDGSKAITNLRNSLQGLNTQPVLCPLWPAWFQPGVTPPVSAPYYVEIGDSVAPAIIAAAALPSARPCCPLMIGRLDELPEPGVFIDNVAEVEFSFLENDDTSLTMPVFTPSNGPASANGARPLFPFRPDWATAPKSGKAEVSIERKEIGKTRTTADAYYIQLSRRTLSQSFTLYNFGDAWNLLSLFQSMGAAVENFWMPGDISEAALTADAQSTDTWLMVDCPANIGGNTYVLLDDLNNRSVATVTGTHGSQWNLSAAVGTHFGADTTRLETIFLARFDQQKIKLKFWDIGFCVVDINFEEVPYEVGGASEETIGTTFGPLPTNAYLYVFSIDYPGGAEMFYFTNFERDLSDGVNTYTHCDIDNTDITETDTIERQSVTINSRNFLGNPLTLMLPFQLEWPLNVIIYEADVNDSASTVANLRALFNGEITDCSSDGPYLNATAESMSYIFDRSVPRRLYQTGCNWILFEPKCTLSAAAWTWNADVVSWDGNATLVVGTITSGNAASLIAHFFALGFITLGAGKSKQLRMITDSSVESGGQITLTLSTPLTGAIAVGTGLTINPGCDGLYSTCAGYSNTANFGGFPFIPVSNPTLLQSQSINAGKKG